MFLGLLKSLSFSAIFFINFASFYLSAANVEFNIDESGYMHVCLSGEKCYATNFSEGDLEFYYKMHKDESLMSGFAYGITRDEEYVKWRFGVSENRFKQGQPHGLLTIRINQNDGSEIPIGYIVAGGGDRLGTSEVAYMIDTPYQNQGYASDMVRALTTSWFNKVKENNYQCFGDKSLEQLDATTSITNIFSIKVLTKNGFVPAEIGVLNEEPIPLTEFINKINTQELKKDKRYKIIDEEGKLRTISFSERFSCLKYHWEYKG